MDALFDHIYNNAVKGEILWLLHSDHTSYTLCIPLEYCDIYLFRL